MSVRACCVMNISEQRCKLWRCVSHTTWTTGVMRYRRWMTGTVLPLAHVSLKFIFNSDSRCIA